MVFIWRYFNNTIATQWFGSFVVAVKVMLIWLSLEEFPWIFVSWVWAWPTWLFLSFSFYSEALILSNLSGFWISTPVGISGYQSTSLYVSLFAGSFCSPGSPGACGLSLSAPGQKKHSIGRTMLQNWTELMTKIVGEGGSEGLEKETRGSTIKCQKRTDGDEEDEL